MSTEHAGWKGRHDNPSGTATITAGGKTLAITLPDFATYSALMELIRAARNDARQAQAAYLRGAIGRLLDQQ